MVRPARQPDRPGARDYFEAAISLLMLVLGIRILWNLRTSLRGLILVVGLSFIGFSLYRLYWVAVYLRNRRAVAVKRGAGG